MKILLNAVIIVLCFVAITNCQEGESEGSQSYIKGVWEKIKKSFNALMDDMKEMVTDMKGKGAEMWETMKQKWEEMMKSSDMSESEKNTMMNMMERMKMAEENSER